MDSDEVKLTFVLDKSQLDYVTSQVQCTKIKIVISFLANQLLFFAFCFSQTRRPLNFLVIISNIFWHKCCSEMPKEANESCAIILSIILCCILTNSTSQFCSVVISISLKESL